jgi:hypothetical protein
MLSGAGASGIVASDKELSPANHRIIQFKEIKSDTLSGESCGQVLVIEIGLSCGGPTTGTCPVSSPPNLHFV